jgi:hypothetical protein
MPGTREAGISTSDTTVSAVGSSARVYWISQRTCSPSARQSVHVSVIVGAASSKSVRSSRHSCSTTHTNAPLGSRRQCVMFFVGTGTRYASPTPRFSKSAMSVASRPASGNSTRQYAVRVTKASSSRARRKSCRSVPTPSQSSRNVE